MYRAFAAGFLTGKLINNQHAGTRFDTTNPLGDVIQKMFGAEELHQAMQDFDTSTRALGLAPMEVAIRWIVHHSSLRDQDAIILGASKTAQVSETMALISKGELPDAVLSLVEKLWAAVRVGRGGIV
jgi:aflatoxin B1 aldehyde reductase